MPPVVPGRLVQGHVYPQFLPDGRHLLYLARAVPSRKGIYMASIDSTGTTFSGGAVPRGARYAAPDISWSCRRAASWRAPLRSEHAATAIEAVAGGPTGWPSLRPMAVSRTTLADGGVLVYRANGLLASSQPVLVNITGKTVATVGRPGDYQTAGVSPDGLKVAVEKASGPPHEHWRPVAHRPPPRIDLPTLHVRRDARQHRDLVARQQEHRLYRSSPTALAICISKSWRRVRWGAVRVRARQNPDRLVVQRPAHSIFTKDYAQGATSGFCRCPRRPPPGRRFCISEADETGGQFTPDGHWVAYVSRTKPAGPPEV